MELIEQNPYRILGVLSNAPKKEIAANYAKIKAFVKTGKAISFDNDFDLILGSIERKEETSLNAYNALSLPKDRVMFGLFWFVGESTISNIITLSYLRKGQLEKAVKVLVKSSNASSCINLAVISIIKKNWPAALYYYGYLLNDSKMCCEYLSMVADNPNLLSKDEVMRMLADKLVMFWPDVQWMEYLNQTEVQLCDERVDIKDFFKESNFYKYLSKRGRDISIKRIEDSLAKAEGSEGDNAERNLNAAKNLVECTRVLLHSLRACHDTDDIDYKLYCDKTANQIVNNCIDYYNHALDNPMRSRNILALLDYAMQIAKSKKIKDRCKDNYNQIRKECEALTPEEIETEIEYINKQIAEFKRLNSITNYAGYLNAILGVCYQKLELIKIKVGENNSHYIKISSLVVDFGVEIITEEINKSLEEYKEANSTDDQKYLSALRQELSWGQSIFNTLKTFIKDSSCKTRYDKQYNSFVQLYLDINCDARPTLKVCAPEIVLLWQVFHIVFEINYSGFIKFTPPSFDYLEVLGAPTISKSTKGTTYDYKLVAKVPGPQTITSAFAKAGVNIVKSTPLTINAIGVGKTNASPKTSNNSSHSHASARRHTIEQPEAKQRSRFGCVTWFIIAELLLLLFVIIIGWIF